MKNKKLFLIAGEPSGDLHGANLARSLKELSPNIELLGMGGEKMHAAGVRLIENITPLAVVGFTEVVKNLARFRRIFNRLTRELARQKPDAVVLIDYPGFNLRFAKEVKKRNITLIYYISPQVWAWGKGRIRTIKRLVDKMIVLFKFEEELYKKAGIPVVFVGHPLVDLVRISSSDISKQPPGSPEIKSEGSLKNKPFDGLTISLLPGSRKTEVQKILPIMLKTAKIISSRLNPVRSRSRFVGTAFDPLCQGTSNGVKNVRFLLSKSPNVKEKKFHETVKKFSLPITLAENNRCLAEADLILVCSGTATLETALYQKPMLIIYKTSFLTALLAKFLLKIPYIGLINIVAGKKIVPEFIQYKAKPQRIAQEALELIKNRQKIEETKQELRKAILNLGQGGASKRAAEAVLTALHSAH